MSLDEKQIDKILEYITIPQDFVDFVLKKLRKDHEFEVKTRQTTEQIILSTINANKRKLDNLLSKYLSDENVNGEIISDEEYKQQKATLQQSIKTLEEQSQGFTQKQASWMDTAEKTFNFAQHAREKIFNRNERVEENDIGSVRFEPDTRKPTITSGLAKTSREH